MKDATILILDDEPSVVKGIQDLIEFETDYHVIPATSPYEALELFNKNDVHVILTDFLMPGMNGIEFLIEAKKKEKSLITTMIILTGYADKENAIKAINEVGIYQYIEKPWDNDELLIILKNAVERGDLLTELRRKYKEIREAYIGTIYRLATTSEMFEEDTFSHVLRISLVSQKLAELSGEDEEYCHNIKYASMMHDVGKIGVPKELLTKRGKLNPAEYEVIKQHSEIGSHILRNPENQLIDMAFDIALFHHEKYNGKGYPKRINDGKIPKAARIVAIADVFDALLSERPYKPPYSPEKVREIVKDGKGIHFDPELSKIFLENFDTFVKIFNDISSIEKEDLSRVLFRYKI